MELRQIFLVADGKMKKTTQILKEDLSSIRTGTASPALVDKIKVDYQNYQLNLNELAAISVPEPRTILIQPWDENALESITKAVLKSGLGLTPIKQGKIIRLNLPPLTEERRLELTKLVKRKAEEARTALRHIRQQALEEIRKSEKEKLISQDESGRAIEQLEKLTNSYMEQIKHLAEVKEREIMEI